MRNKITTIVGIITLLLAITAWIFTRLYKSYLIKIICCIGIVILFVCLISAFVDMIRAFVRRNQKANTCIAITKVGGMLLVAKCFCEDCQNLALFNPHIKDIS